MHMYYHPCPWYLKFLLAENFQVSFIFNLPEGSPINKFLTPSGVMYLTPAQEITNQAANKANFLEDGVK